MIRPEIFADGALSVLREMLLAPRAPIIQRLNQTDLNNWEQTGVRPTHGWSRAWGDDDLGGVRPKFAFKPFDFF